ncbi:ubiquitin smt3 [Fusarium austroafricanum]|uniref:Ubiquitin smt3 n=1 Tax=Fusarium austroafricanum TaxID=2364996 RepID=A0A8H4KSM9_9HYPO|nr:ubiquitin smt3 [Fusarium austroafricanum]
MSQDQGVSSSLKNLSIDIQNEPAKSSTKPITNKKKAKQVVADSWEDSDSDSEPEAESESNKPTPSATPAPPPPTPMSPAGGLSWESPTGSAGYRAGADPDRRPEKTDAVARRMIAAGLGLKAPKQTEEQRAYQKSVREQEKKRREQEREEEKKRQAEVEKAKAAIWDD